jgi:mannose-6-phosphate isomerase-like protein (cupin superfamily)
MAIVPSASKDDHTMRIARFVTAILFGWVAFTVPARPQSVGAAAYTSKHLIELAREMREHSGEGGHPTADALEQHLDQATVLAVRIQSGRAELHPASADEFFVIQGRATLVTGGTIVNARGSGEIRGDSVHDGVHKELTPGDVVYIPANTPHQLLMTGSDSFVYVLVKVPAR